MNRNTNGTRKDNTYAPLDNIKRIFNEENQIDYDKLLEDYSLLAEEDIFLGPRVTFNDKTRTKNDIICHRIMNKQNVGLDSDLDFDIINFVEIWREVKSKFSYKKKNDPDFHQLCEFMHDWEKISYKMQKLYDILYFAERRKSRENLKNFTNNLLRSFTDYRYFIRNSSFAKLNDFDIEPLVSQYKKPSVSKCMQNNDLSVEEINVLLRVSQKCWPLNRKKILQRLLIKDGNGRSGLNRIADIVNNLPIDQVDNFYRWLYQNINNLTNENGLVNDLWERAQNNGFLSREQESLLQLVPPEIQDEFRKLFQNKNFRKVCQTPQAVKNLLTITEACSLSPIEYINHCLPYGKIEHIKIALDTFNADKIYNVFGDQLNQFPDGVKKMYLFYFIHSWITFSFAINEIDDSIISKENKNKLFNESQLVCADYLRLQQFVLELSDPTNIKDNLFNYLDKIFSMDAIKYYKENIEKVESGGNFKSFDTIEKMSRNFLKQYGYTEDKNVTETFSNGFAMFATVDFNDELYFANDLFADFLLVADYNCIVDLYDYAAKENNWCLYDILIKNLDKPKFKEIKIEVMKVIVERKKHFITETFENDKSKIKKFYELAKTCDVFKFINSKEDVLQLNEFLNLGLDVNQIDILDWSSIKSELSKISDESSKKILKQKIVELVKKCDIEGPINTAFKIINSLIVNKCTYELMSTLNSFVKWRAKDTLKSFADILLSMDQSVENLANIVTLLQKTENTNAMDLGAHLAANPEVAMKLTENNVPPQENFNLNEKGK